MICGSTTIVSALQPQSSGFIADRINPQDPGKMPFPLSWNHNSPIATTQDRTDVKLLPATGKYFSRVRRIGGKPITPDC